MNFWIKCEFLPQRAVVIFVVPTNTQSNHVSIISQEVLLLRKIILLWAGNFSHHAFHYSLLLYAISTTKAWFFHMTEQKTVTIWVPLSSCFFFFFLLLYQLRHQVPLPPGLGTKKWKGDKGQGQTVEERKLGMTLQLETYTKFYLLEISLWSSSAGGNTAKHLQYWKPGKCIPWKKAREPKFLLLAKTEVIFVAKCVSKKAAGKKHSCF